MRDWIDSRESKLSARKHRLILTVAIAVLCVLILILAVSQTYLLSRAESGTNSTLSQLQLREASLFELETVLARGNVFHEFAAADLMNDLPQANIIRRRFTAGRDILLSDVFASFPQLIVRDLVRLLDMHSSYQSGASESLISVSPPLNPQVAAQKLVTGLQALRAYEQEWVSALAISVLDQRVRWHQQSQFIFILLLLCLLPLAVGIYFARKFVKEHQCMLDTSEYFYRLINTLPGIVMLTDRSGHILLASESTAKFLMYPREQLSRMDMLSLLPKRFRQQYKLFSNNYMDGSAERGGQRVKGRELLILNSEGVEIPVELHFGDFDTLDGEVVVVCLQDVSERRDLYQKYQHSQKRFEMAMMASRDGLWDWDMINGSVFFSPSWLSMIGIKGGQPLDGRAVFDASIHPDDRVRVRQAIQDFLKSDNTVFRDEHRLRRIDGSVCDAVTRACAQRDSSGEVIRIVGMHSDVTHFKDVEREVRRLNRNLEDRVRLRTQQLESAVMQAEKASRTKATFLSVMGHEVRTPMNGVIGMADLLSKTKLDREQWMMVDTVRRSSMSLLATLDNILDYSALDSGDVELEVESIQLAEFVEGVADEFAGSAAKNKIRFILYINPAVPAAVFADATRLRKILVNLLGNAIKFTKSRSGGGLLQLRLSTAETEAATCQNITFEVIDNGVGVSEEMRLQLFSPFMLEENSRARRFGGTGLGLAITTRLLDLMGGEIALDEDHLEGSRFVFSIPFTVDASSKRIVVGGGIVVFASIGDDLLKESVKAALALGGQEVSWVSSAADLAEQLSTIKQDNVVLILAHDADSDLLEYCKTQMVRTICIAPRPSRLNSRDPRTVYSDPLLPSALARAVEYRPRLMLEKF
ncbi:PAS domain-containing sensor histidine kinase [Zhongshania sp.]|uniref:PAS domain-containing sensor histidine kinase n=1 Tax=Zhongshania sp. TaxID=1971902 RepID=UPI0039E2A84F